VTISGDTSVSQSGAKTTRDEKNVIFLSLSLFLSLVSVLSRKHTKNVHTLVTLLTTVEHNIRVQMHSRGRMVRCLLEKFLSPLSLYKTGCMHIYVRVQESIPCLWCRTTIHFVWPSAFNASDYISWKSESRIYTLKIINSNKHTLIVCAH